MRLSLRQIPILCLWALAATAVLGRPFPVAAAVAASATVDAVVVKLLGDADQTAGLSPDDRNAIYGALQVPFAHVGFTRDGAYRLQLSNTLPIGAARIALNRVRLLPDILYANVSSPAPRIRY